MHYLKFSKDSYRTALFIPIMLIAIVYTSCTERQKEKDSLSPKVAAKKHRLSQEFKAYWYNGTAEITSYSLEQARYGELRKGNAVLIYVTEPFNADKQVKADQHNANNIPVLKLNSTKKFLTGIYPYSIMTSSFYPVNREGHALKITNSVQEWCGHVFTQLNNRDQFEISSFSYFESEGDKAFSLPKETLENEIWNMIRVHPEKLPTGNINIVPSFEFLRLNHKEIKSYKAEASLKKEGDWTIYTVHYPGLQRTLKIQFSAAFPYTIEGWTDSYTSGFGTNAKTLTSTAKKVSRLNTAYWRENKNSDLFLRDSLGLQK